MLKSIKSPNQTYLSKTISVDVSAGVLKSVLSATSLISVVIELLLDYEKYSIIRIIFNYEHNIQFDNVIGT